jgi:hypothetical protein
MQVLNDGRGAAPTAPGQALPFALLLSVVAAAAMIGTTLLTRRGPMILIPYAALMLGIAAYFRRRHIGPFTTRFVVALTAFMLASVILETYVVVFVNPAARQAPLWHHLWPLAAFLGIGSLASALVGFISRSRSVSTA